MIKKLLGLIGLSLVLQTSAHAYIVDGNISDWGINLADAASKNRNYLDTHTPTAPTANYVTEDNAMYTDGLIFVGPGWANKNNYDAEALYFDNDLSKAYLAVVTGVAKTEATYPAGDIFIDTGKYQNPSSPFYNPLKYQYAIKISDSKLYEVTSWQNSMIYHASDPWRMAAGNYIADVPFVYSGNQNTHYVLESSFNLSTLNLKDGDAAYLHWTMGCGNDDLRLKASVNVVPEPASMALLAGGLMMGVKRFRSRKTV